MPRIERFLRHCLFLSALTLSSLTLFAAASWADDDLHVVAIQGYTLPISFTELIGHHGSETTTLTIVSSPTLGRLWTDEGIGLIYEPNEDAPHVFAHDEFTFEIPNTDPVEHGRVVIRVLPRRIQVIGDFYGDPMLEVGFYRPAFSDFKICPFEATPLNATCNRLEVPAAPPGIPLVGAWNGGGLDELAIYDPLSGIVHVLGAPPPASQAMTVLTTLQGPIDGWPTLGPVDEGFLFWQPQDEKFTLYPLLDKPIEHLLPAALPETDDLQPIGQRTTDRLGLAFVGPGEVHWYQANIPGGPAEQVFVDPLSDQLLYLWANGALGDLWIRFDPRITRLLVAPIVPLPDSDGSTQGVTIVIDLPDDPD